MRTVALVPMRHSSERVRGKNFRLLGGRPLFHHVIGMLLECPAVSDVIIDTDSDLIRDDARHSFPSVTLLERPEALAGGEVPMNDVLLNDVRQVPADVYLQTHSTNPFLTSASVMGAIEAFADGHVHDSLFSVTKLQTRLWQADGAAINHDPARLVRTQDLVPVFEENSCIYLFTRASLERDGNRIGRKPLMFEIPAREALDIDDEWDFRTAEALMRVREGE